MPYTYTMLNEYLNKNVTKEKAKRNNLCYSLAGNKVEYLYITSKTKKVEPPTGTLIGADESEQNSNIQSRKRIEISTGNGGS